MPDVDGKTDSARFPCQNVCYAHRSCQSEKNKYAVTDGGGCDAQLRHNDGNKVLHALWKVMRLADQTDLGRSLFKQTNSAWFTHTMSPDATTEGNDLNKKGSSHDIKATCSLVLNEFWKKNCENFEKLLKWLP